jgi:hypothetical protein
MITVAVVCVFNAAGIVFFNADRRMNSFALKQPVANRAAACITAAAPTGNPRAQAACTEVILCRLSVATVQPETPVCLKDCVLTNER